jgi:hypothetical protein
MRNLIFDTPWWLLAVLAVLAATLFVSGNNRQDKNLTRGGLFFLALLGILALLSYLVDTDVEKVSKRTKLLAASVEKRDWKTFESLFDRRVHFAIYDGRDMLVEGAKQTADRIELKSARITSIRLNEDATGITVDCDALSVQGATMDRPIPTSWRFEWQDNGSDGWVIKNVAPLPNGQVTPDRVTERLARPR